MKNLIFCIAILCLFFASCDDSGEKEKAVNVTPIDNTDEQKEPQQEVKQDMRFKKNLQITRKFNVKPEVVFDAFTKPEKMKSWWTENTTFDIDLKVGGKWKIVRKEGGEVYTALGKYLEINKPNLVRYTYSMPQFSSNEDIISINIIRTAQGGCQVVFVQEGDDIHEELSALPAGKKSESEKGWQMAFDLMSKNW